jgi:CheY-like chemotaxis protein
MARVLIVDDDDIVRMVVAQFLHLGNHTVTQAESGEEAIRLLVQDPPDLVVTDLSMPGMGGRQLRERSHLLKPGLPFIAMSGYIVGEDIRAEFSETLEKPLRSADILNAVENILSRIPMVA